MAADLDDFLRDRKSVYYLAKNSVSRGLRHKRVAQKKSKFSVKLICKHAGLVMSFTLI